MGDVGPGNRGWGSQMGPGMMTELAGSAPAVPPTGTDIWVAQTSGSGPRSLQWTPGNGNWTVVVMRADGTAGVSATMRAAATVPALTGVSVGLLLGGLVLLAGGGLLIALAVHRAQTPPGPPVPVWPVEPVPPAGPAPRVPPPPAATEPAPGTSPSARVR
jgi:hypothetical protein